MNNMIYNIVPRLFIYTNYSYIKTKYLYKYINIYIIKL